MTRTTQKHSKAYAMWGIPKGSTERFEEVLLLSDASDAVRAEKVKKIAARDGFHSFRVASVDLDRPANFAGTVNSKDSQVGRGSENKVIGKGE